MPSNQEVYQPQLPFEAPSDENRQEVVQTPISRSRERSLVSHSRRVSEAAADQGWGNPEDIESANKKPFYISTEQEWKDYCTTSLEVVSGKPSGGIKRLYNNAKNHYLDSARAFDEAADNLDQDEESHSLQFEYQKAKDRYKLWKTRLEELESDRNIWNTIQGV